MQSGRPRKSLGQHFLTREKSIRRIVDALGIRPGDPVVEIGPGRGALTADLIDAAGRIAAIELDGDLASAIADRFGDALILFRGDVLRIDLGQVRDRLTPDPGRRLLVAGNLPYNISKPVVQKLIRERGLVDRAVLMFQREVALRLTAAPGSKDYGPLGILAGAAYRISMLFDLPPQAFTPRPKVDSTVTAWTRRDGPPLDEARHRSLRTCLAVCFANRRRTLRNNLRAVAAEDRNVERLLENVGIDGGLRAEAVPPSGFERLAAQWDLLAG